MLYIVHAEPVEAPLCECPSEAQLSRSDTGSGRTEVSYA